MAILGKFCCNRPVPTEKSVLTGPQSPRQNPYVERVSKGSRYSLLVGDKVYTLVTNDKVLLATLDKRAGAKVTITGAEKENIITVTSVKPAR